MVLCIDTAGLTYAIISSTATNITGSVYLATLLIALFLMALCAMFGIPLEFIAVILLPLHLAFVACLGADWIAITGVILIYLGILLGKNLFFRR